MDPTSASGTLNQAFAMLADLAQQHLPAASGWLPLATLAGVGLLGLILLLRGARLTPLFVALAFLAAGAGGGALLARSLVLPTWPVATAGALVACLAGVLFQRIWIAIALAAVLAAAGVTAYCGKAATPYLDAYLYKGLDQQNQLVTLAQEAPTGATTSPTQLAADLWAYLSGQVPNFQTNFLLIALATGAGGFIFAFFLPWLSRSILCATGGTILTLAAVMMLLQQFWPTAAEWLTTIGPWGWAAVGVVWLASLLINLASARRRAPAPRAVAVAPVARPATAT